MNAPRTRSDPNLRTAPQRVNGISRTSGNTCSRVFRSTAQRRTTTVRTARRSESRVISFLCDQAGGSNRFVCQATADNGNGGKLCVERAARDFSTMAAGNKTHSCRNATAGSTRVARHAGMRVAIRAAPRSGKVAMTRLTGSTGLTPYSNDRSKRVAKNAPSIPAATPATASFRPWLTTSRSTVRGLAPSAMRTPIERVCCTTAYDITP